MINLKKCLAYSSFKLNEKEMQIKRLVDQFKFNSNPGSKLEFKKHSEFSFEWCTTLAFRS